MSARTTTHRTQFVVIEIPAIQPDGILDKNKVLGASHCYGSATPENAEGITEKKKRIYLVGK